MKEELGNQEFYIKLEMPTRHLSGGVEKIFGYTHLELMGEIRMEIQI